MIIFRIFTIAFIAASVLYGSVSYPRSGACSIKIVNSAGKSVNISAETADTEVKRSAGLMYRRILGDNEGMLFVFETAEHRQFWMKNTYIPLSIAYIGKDRIINEIYDMKPLDERITYSQKPAMYALEMKQGWFARSNITAGCRLELDGCLGK